MKFKKELVVKDAFVSDGNVKNLLNFLTFLPESGNIVINVKHYKAFLEACDDFADSALSKLDENAIKELKSEYKEFSDKEMRQ